MTRTKKIILIVVLAAVVLAVATVILPSVLGGETFTVAELERLADKDIPTAVYLWLEENKHSEGFGAFYSQGWVYLAVRMGQRPTGGYSVHLGDAQANGDITVKVHYKTPKPWDMVTQVITYPRTAVKVECPEGPPRAAIFLSVKDAVLAKVDIINLDDAEKAE